MSILTDDRRKSFTQQIADALAQRAERELADSKMWKALSGPQSTAYECLADELLYGGQAGGGKTDLLIGLACTAHRSSVIFRREFSQFRGPEGAIERSRQIIGNRGHLNQSLYMWKGLPGGRAIEFGACEHETDKEKWKGRAHDLKGFDELSEFTKSQYEFIIAWNRTTHVGQRCRVVSGSNPPTTEEGQWMIDYWREFLDDTHPHPALPGELRWYARVDGEQVPVKNGDPFYNGNELIYPKSRTFIAASVRDNPFLMATDYVSRLQNLPEPLRSQLLYGDFKKTQGDNPWQVIPGEWVKLAQARWTPKKPDVPLSAIGCDPSRGGADETGIGKRYANWLAPLIMHPGKKVIDGPYVAGLVMQELENPEAVINIDVGGIGSSPYDFLKEQMVIVRGKPQRVNVIPLNGAEASQAWDKSGKLKFVNKRAEWHWKFREMLDPSTNHNIALPPGADLYKDLTAPKWKLTRGGIQIEAKEEIKARIGRSPDKGETAIYSFVERIVWRTA